MKVLTQESQIHVDANHYVVYHNTIGLLFIVLHQIRIRLLIGFGICTLG